LHVIIGLEYRSSGVFGVTRNVHVGVEPNPVMVKEEEINVGVPYEAERILLFDPVVVFETFSDSVALKLEPSESKDLGVAYHLLDRFSY
jgi:hypothetical protein